jgi:ribosomal protein L11 methyltransferase
MLAAVGQIERGWCVVRLELADHLADAAASLLADEGVTTLVTGVRDMTPGARVPRRAVLEAHVREASAPHLAETLSGWLTSLATIEPAARDARVTTDALPAVDWDAVFRRHHHPITIGARLLVAPPWDVPEAPGREVLVIQPGMAFGTGQHETTRTCLEEIEALAAPGTVRSALDVGTGSGVLAAALSRLGVPSVVALDTDRAVIPLARSNLIRNRAGAVVLVVGGVSAVRGPFDVVVANLLADLLIAEAAALVGVLAPGGRLVVSGVLDTQVDAVIAALPGLRLAASRLAGPWRTLRLQR